MDIDTLKMFVLLARKLNFTETSKVLQVSQPTLSRKIKMLEESIHVTLIHRRGGHISLTPQGETFLQQAEILLAQIEKSIELVQSEKLEESGVIRIGCLHPMATFITEHFITEFHARYPLITLHFKTMIPKTLSLFEDVDIMIAPFWPEDDNIVAKPLATYRRYCYASKAYLAARGTPTDVSQLSEHWCVTQTNAIDKQTSWSLQNRAGEQIKVPVSGCMAADSVDVTIELIKKGFGIGLIGHYKAQRSDPDNQLVPIFGNDWFVDGRMYLMHKQSLHTPKRFKLFMEAFIETYNKIAQ